jgi:hypothetical protein
MSHGKSAVVHGLQFGQRAASKATKVGRAAVSRASGLARSGVSKVASLGKAGLSNAGSLLKGAATGGKLATGALTAAKLLGPAAIGTVATMAFDKFMPDFKGKATMSAMAQGASMGAMLGPIGAAVGAGAGAIYANWDEITDTVSTAFKGIKDFDYTGAIKSAGKYLAPLGGALSMGATIIYDNWGTIKDTVSSGFEAIASFDYAGAFTKAASFLSPIADGVKWYVDTIWNSWKQVGSFISDGFGKVKNFLFGGDDATKKAGDLSKPLSDKFGAFSNTNSLIGGAGLGMGSMPNVNAPISLTPNAGVDLFGNQQPGPSIAAPVTPATPPAPKINTDHVTAHTAGWKEQTLQLQKENLETRKQMAQLMDVLANGNDKTVGGLRDLIGEQQKSNRNLDVISGSII